MKSPRIGWRDWVGASAAGFILVFVVFGLFRAPTRDARTSRTDAGSAVQRAPAPDSVGLVQLRDSNDALLKEDATLRDPTPLFLPTEWNASNDATSGDRHRDPGLSLHDFPPILRFPEAELHLPMPAVVELPARPADAFATDKPAAPFAGFGESDVAIAALPARAAFIEVAAAADGRLLLSQPLIDAQPPAGANWQPLEFLVTVDRAGVVRPAVLTESSRVAAVDAYFEDYLVAGLRLGERLAPGFYRVTVGP